MTAAPRAFLFLQGMATPFFARLGGALAARGHAVHRVNFNAGDRLFWPWPAAVDFSGHPADWPGFLTRLLAERRITDVVMFSDCRPLHAAAISVARAHGVAVWVFEEGYLRPGFLTLERGGVNGNSAMPRTPQAVLRAAEGLPPAPREALWSGSFRRRAVDDVRYNLAAVLRRRDFPHWRTHRPWHPFHEYLGFARRGALRPVVRLLAQRRNRVLFASGAPFFLFPLQLDGDYQVRVWSPFNSVRDAIEAVIVSFARAAPAEARLAVKGHPLDNGLRRWGRETRRIAEAHGIAERVVWLPEVAYGPLLAAARGVVTINSTAGLQALREGKPVAVLGTALYDMPGLTWQAELDAFWGAPAPPDMALVDALRRVLVARCLIEGGLWDEAAIARAVECAAERLLSAPAGASALTVTAV